MKRLAFAAAVLLFATGAFAQRGGGFHGGGRPSTPSSPSHPTTMAPVPRGTMAPVPRGTTGTVPASPSRVVPPVYSTRPPTDLTPANAPRGPFDARPGTYRPRYDPHYDRRWNGYRNGYYGAPYFYGSGSFFNDSYPADSTSAPAVPVGPGSDDSFLTQPQEQPVASAPIPAPPPPVLHHPDTFYVIPGCYVGNLRPKQEQLPKGCDMSKMKTMPVR